MWIYFKIIITDTRFYVIVVHISSQYQQVANIYVLLIFVVSFREYIR